MPPLSCIHNLYMPHLTVRHITPVSRALRHRTYASSSSPPSSSLAFSMSKSESTPHFTAVGPHLPVRPWHKDDREILYFPPPLPSVAPLPTSFFSYLDAAPPAHFVSFLKHMLQHAAREHHVTEYHFSIADKMHSTSGGNGKDHAAETMTTTTNGSSSSPTPPPPAFAASLIYNHGQSLLGPIHASACMSCSLDAPLSGGVFGDEEDASSPLARDSLLLERNGVRYWIDGKARACLIATPIEHVQFLTDLSDETMHELYAGMRDVCRMMECEPVDRLVINAGMFQTHGHVHLKAYIPQTVYEKASKSALWKERGWGAKYERIASWIARRIEDDKAKRH